MSSPVLPMPADFYQHAVELSLKKLTEQERKVIFLRFWEALPIARVADSLGFTWEQADVLIDEAATKLRNEMARLLAERKQAQSPQFQSA